MSDISCQMLAQSNTTRWEGTSGLLPYFFRGIDKHHRHQVQHITCHNRLCCNKLRHHTPTPQRVWLPESPPTPPGFGDCSFPSRTFWRNGC